MYSTLQLSSILHTKSGVYYAEHFQMAVYRPVRGDRLADHRLHSGVLQALQKKIGQAEVKEGVHQRRCFRASHKGELGKRPADFCGTFCSKKDPPLNSENLGEGREGV
jgi:hypothetical protein